MSGEEMTPIVESKPFPGSKESDHEGSSSTESSSPISPIPITAQAIDIPVKSPNISPTTDMSASYHEIFDTQMPIPPSDSNRGEDVDDEDLEATDERLAPLLCCDNNTVSTTEYLTSKLVEDSLKWQRECKADKSSFSSPKESPIRKQRLQNINEDMKSLSLNPNQKIDALDPTAIEDVEKHARYLAACVDSMVENLSGNIPF